MINGLPIGRRLIRRDIIVVGASAGGVEALTQFVSELPTDIPAAIFAVLHFPANGISVLHQILNRAGSLPAKQAQDGEQFKPGHVYVARPDYHLVIELGEIRLEHGPRENGFRPAIDLLFRSAAQSYNQQVIGVILSGMLDDGTQGLSIIKQRGGIAIVQDPEEAMFPSMPSSAIKHVNVDHIKRIDDMPKLLVQLTNERLLQIANEPNEPADVGGLPMSDEKKLDEQQVEAEIVRQDKAVLEQGARPNEPSTLTCPDCGGVLWELNNGSIMRFRCHVGHAYSADSLLSSQADSVETALWSAVRALEERAALARRMAAQARHHNRLQSAKQFMQRAEEAHQHADTIRKVIYVGEPKSELSQAQNLELLQE